MTMDQVEAVPDMAANDMSLNVSNDSKRKTAIPDGLLPAYLASAFGELYEVRLRLLLSYY